MQINDVAQKHCVIAFWLTTQIITVYTECSSYQLSFIKEEIIWTMIVIIIIFMHCIIMTLGNVQELGRSAPQTHSYVGPPKVNYFPTPLMGSVVLCGGHGAVWWYMCGGHGAVGGTCVMDMGQCGGTCVVDTGQCGGTCVVDTGQCGCVWWTRGSVVVCGGHGAVWWCVVDMGQCGGVWWTWGSVRGGVWWTWGLGCCV